MDWIHLTHDKGSWRALVTVVMNLGMPQNEGNFLTIWGPVIFSRTTLLHGVSNLLSVASACLPSVSAPGSAPGTCNFAFRHRAQPSPNKSQPNVLLSEHGTCCYEGNTWSYKRIIFSINYFLERLLLRQATD